MFDIKKILGMMMNPIETMEKLNAPITYEKPQQVQTTVPQTQTPAEASQNALVRGKYNISDADWEEAKHILYGEISDRDIDKQKLEAAVILNTAINRMSQYEEKTGKPVSLTEVLQKPNQYQAYSPDKPDSLYSQSKRGEYKPGGERRIQAINDVFNEAKSGKLEDNTNGAVFYIHNPDGTITYDDTKKLYE